MKKDRLRQAGVLMLWIIGLPAAALLGLALGLYLALFFYCLAGRGILREMAAE